MVITISNPIIISTNNPFVTFETPFFIKLVIWTLQVVKGALEPTSVNVTTLKNAKQKISRGTKSR